MVKKLTNRVSIIGPFCTLLNLVRYRLTERKKPFSIMLPLPLPHYLCRCRICCSVPLYGCWFHVTAVFAMILLPVSLPLPPQYCHYIVTTAITITVAAPLMNCCFSCTYRVTTAIPVEVAITVGYTMLPLPYLLSHCCYHCHYHAALLPLTCHPYHYHVIIYIAIIALLPPLHVPLPL